MSKHPGHALRFFWDCKKMSKRQKPILFFYFFVVSEQKLRILSTVKVKRSDFFVPTKIFCFFFNFRNFSDSGFDKLEIQTTGEKKSEIEISLFFSLSIKHFMMFWFFSQWYVYFIFTLRLPRTGRGGANLRYFGFRSFFLSTSPQLRHLAYSILI